MRALAERAWRHTTSLPRSSRSSCLTRSSRPPIRVPPFVPPPSKLAEDFAAARARLASRRSARAFLGDLGTDGPGADAQASDDAAILDAANVDADIDANNATDAGVDAPPAECST